MDAVAVRGACRKELDVHALYMFVNGGHIKHDGQQSNRSLDVLHEELVYLCSKPFTVELGLGLGLELG